MTHLDDPAIDDHDLRIERPAVADAQNGVALLERAIEQAWWPPDQASHLEDLRTGVLVDAELEREVIARNETALAAVPAMLAAPLFVVPSIEAPGGPYGSFSWLRISVLLAIRAVHRANAGDADGAVSDALAAATLGARLEAAHGAVLLDAMAGASAKEIGLDALGRTLARADVDAARSRELTTQLATLHVDPEGWRRAWAAEYAKEIPMVPERLEGEGSLWTRRIVTHYVFKPNATKARFAEIFRTFGTQGGLPCARARWPEEPPTGVDRLAALLGPNGAGRAFSWLEMHGRRDLALRRCREHTHVEAARAWVALRAYSRDSGGMPERLEELVPTYLAGVPTDAFDGEPLRYDRTRRLLWSIGTDFVDAGGSGEEEREPVFPIPF